MSEGEGKNHYLSIFITLVFICVGIGVLALTKHVAKIEGDALFVALLLIPIFIYLAIRGKLKELKIGPEGVSASLFKESVDDIKKHVEDSITETSEYEEERSTYLGKLEQILRQRRRFCLIYADVDHLRQHTRQTFLNEKKQSVSLDERYSENKIRQTIIRELSFALADAFCEHNIKDSNNKYAKYDIFSLNEPDLVMIAREVNVEEAISVAKKGQDNFKNYTLDGNFKGHNATIAIVSRDEMEVPKPRALDEKACKRLTYGKKERRGKIYVSSPS